MYHVSTEKQISNVCVAWFNLCVKHASLSDNRKNAVGISKLENTKLAQIGRSNPWSVLVMSQAECVCLPLFPNWYWCSDVGKKNSTRTR